MALAKPRGCTHGIKRYQSEVREQTRSALRKALQMLELECPGSQWKNIQICRKAGLASSAALKKPWNADLFELIQNHNTKVRETLFLEKPETQHVRTTVKHSTSKLIKKLRSELAVRDAELLALEKENTALREQLHRITNNHTRQKWSTDAGALVVYADRPEAS